MTGKERRGGRAATPASPLPRANGNNGLGLFQRFILNSPLLLNATEFGSASRPLKGLAPEVLPVSEGGYTHRRYLPR